MAIDKRSVGDDNFPHYDAMHAERMRYPVATEGLDERHWVKYDPPDNMAGFRARRTESECSDDRRTQWVGGDTVD